MHYKLEIPPGHIGVIFVDGLPGNIYRAGSHYFVPSENVSLFKTGEESCTHTFKVLLPDLNEVAITLHFSWTIDEENIQNVPAEYNCDESERIIPLIQVELNNLLPRMFSEAEQVLLPHSPIKVDPDLSSIGLLLTKAVVQNIVPENLADIRAGRAKAKAKPRKEQIREELLDKLKDRVHNLDELKKLRRETFEQFKDEILNDRDFAKQLRNMFSEAEGRIMGDKDSR